MVALISDRGLRWGRSTKPAQALVLRLKMLQELGGAGRVAGLLAQSFMPVGPANGAAKRKKKPAFGGRLSPGRNKRASLRLRLDAQQFVLELPVGRRVAKPDGHQGAIKGRVLERLGLQLALGVDAQSFGGVPFE